MLSTLYKYNKLRCVLFKNIGMLKNRIFNITLQKKNSELLIKGFKYFLNSKENPYTNKAELHTQAKQIMKLNKIGAIMIIQFSLFLPQLHK